jgi:predicted NBD/HSP70 family sugar kinase
VQYSDVTIESPQHGVIVGMDFNHDRVRVALADQSVTVLGEDFADIDVDSSAVNAIDTALEIVDSLRAAAQIDKPQLSAAGVGLPGPIDRRTGALASVEILPGWAGLPVREMLTRRLGIDVEIENDANLGALGEVLFGAGRGFAHVIYVRVESGIGGALVVDRRVFHGAAGLAGEIGHVHVRSDGPLCRCGNRGCLETIASEGAMAAILGDIHGPVTSRKILELVAAGDLGTTRVVNDAGRAVGRVLADICNVFNPGAIIVGGELAEAGDPLLGGIRESIDRYALSSVAQSVTVLGAELAERAEVLGALALVGKAPADTVP